MPVVVLLAPPPSASVLLRLWRFSVVEEGCVDCAVVEVFRVAFLSSEEDSRAVSLACKSAAIRWAKGTSSMSRKSRVEAATLGSEGEVPSLGCVVVVVAMIAVGPFSLALSGPLLVVRWR